jgi:hypothetical protein
MPVRKKRLRRTKKDHRLTKKFVFLSVLLLGFFYFSLQTKYFRSNSKLILTTASSDYVYVSVFDNQQNEITTVLIPANTQVDVARNLGVWKIGSIWNLGKNEKLGGRLLAETIIKNFNAPVSAWTSSRGIGFSQGGIKNVLVSILMPLSTNLKIGDRIRLGLFSLGVKEFKRTTIDLSKTKYLDRQVLRDGSEGYVLTDDIPQKLLVIFSDPVFAQSNVRVVINDLAGNDQITKKLGEIIEAIGGKVVAVKKGELADTDCIAASQIDRLSKRASELFGCRAIVNKDIDKNTLELTIGGKFEQRF